MRRIYQYGKRSIDNLNTCHEDLIKIMLLAISRSTIDFGISEGHRPVELQKKYFDEGKSKIDGINKKGKHNLTPAEAVDIYGYHSDPGIRRKIAWNTETLSHIAGVIQSCAVELYDKGEIKHLIRWGGNWDKDGVILIDQNFDDLPHFELYKPKS